MSGYSLTDGLCSIPCLGCSLMLQLVPSGWKLMKRTEAMVERFEFLYLQNIFERERVDAPKPEDMPGEGQEKDPISPIE